MPTQRIKDVYMIRSSLLRQWPLGSVIAVALALAWSAPALAADPPPHSTKKSGLTTFKKQGAPKEAEKFEKTGPKQGPKQRVVAKKKTDEGALDDQIGVLRELIDAEKGTTAEANTQLELSYVLWDKAAEYEAEVHADKYELGIPEAEKEGDARRVKLLKIEQRNLEEQARATKEEVVRILKDIESRFSTTIPGKWERLDEVLYSLAFHLNEMQRPDESLDAYMRLVRKAPRSAFVADAYLGIGNYYFAKAKGREAIEWYQKVIEFPQSAVYGWGLYYMGWSYFNLQQYPKAVEMFVKTLDYSTKEAKGRVEFTDEASKYLVMAWAEEGNPREALRFFRKVDTARALDLLFRLAQYYATRSEYAKSNDILRTLIKETGQDPKVLAHQRLVIDNSFKQGNKARVNAECEAYAEMIETYKPKMSAEALAKARHAGAELIAVISTTYHDESERTGEDRTRDVAHGLYKLYLAKFPDGAAVYPIQNNYAIILYQMAKWQDAADAYERVIEMDPKGKFASNAAHTVLVCYLKLQNIDEETKSKADDTQVLKPTPLDKREARVAAACDRYVQIANATKEVEDVPEALFMGGRLYYQHNQFEESAKRFQTYVERFPDHRMAVDGARLLLSAFALSQDGKNLNKWANILLADARFRDSKIAPILQNIKQNEEYNKCLELKEEPAKAGDCLVAYGEKYPGTDQSIRAWLGSARFYRSAKKLEKTIASYVSLQKAKPDAPVAADALFEVGEIYRTTGQFEAAAAAYESFVATYPHGAKVPEALSTATLIRRSLAQHEKVLADAEIFLERFPKDPRGLEVAFEAGLLYVRDKKWKQADKAFSRLMAKREKIPPDLHLLGEVHIGIATWHTGARRKGVALYEGVVKKFKALSDEQRKNMPERGIAAVAQALFQLGEDAFEDLKAIKPPKKGKKALEVAKKMLKDQVGVAKKADDFYSAALAMQSPRWVAAAASRRGSIQLAIATALEGLPPPPEFSGNEELKAQWAAQLAEQAAPFKERAIQRYKGALDDSAKIFAFDDYWTEARDKLKILDPKFALMTSADDYRAQVAQPSLVPQGDAESAAKRGHQALFENDHDKEAFRTLAAAYYAKKDARAVRLVVQAARETAEELKRDAQLLALLGSAELNLGHVRASLLAFEEAGRVDQAHIEGLLNAVAVSFDKLNFVAAMDFSKAILKRDPKQFWARISLAAALRRLGHADDAMTEYDKLVADDPRPEAHYNRCLTAQELFTTDLPKALGICEAAEKVMPKGHPKAHEIQRRVKGIKETIEFSKPG